MKLLNIFKFIWTNLGDFSELATIRFCYFFMIEILVCLYINISALFFKGQLELLKRPKGSRDDWIKVENTTEAK